MIDCKSLAGKVFGALFGILTAAAPLCVEAAPGLFRRVERRASA